MRRRIWRRPCAPMCASPCHLHSENGCASSVIRTGDVAWHTGTRQSVKLRQTPLLRRRRLHHLCTLCRCCAGVSTSTLSCHRRRCLLGLFGVDMRCRLRRLRRCRLLCFAQRGPCRRLLLLSSGAGKRGGGRVVKCMKRLEWIIQCLSSCPHCARPGACRRMHVPPCATNLALRTRHASATCPPATGAARPADAAPGAAAAAAPCRTAAAPPPTAWGKEAFES